jgi:BASS family bile acid:Na+ symporter
MLIKIITSFTFMVSTGIILGFITGGFPYFTNEITTIALIIAMTLSLTQINLKNVKLNKNNLFIPLLINFGLLTSVVLLLGWFFPDDIWKGFVVIAAVPPAIVIIPMTRVLKGDVEFSLVSISFIYVVSVLLTPLIIFIFLSKEIEIMTMIQTLLLLVILPLIISQLIRRFSFPTNKTTAITNFCFFIIVFIMVGSNRLYLFQEIGLIIGISIVVFIRIFGSGFLVKIIGERMGIKKEKLITMILFATIKNEGYAILLAVALFGSIAAVPAIISIIFEMIWISLFEAKIV